MKILFNPTDGEIFYAVFDVDWFRFSHTTNIPLTTMEIDEIAPDNQGVCLDLVRTLNKRDINGLGKYHIVDNAGVLELHDRDGWEEAIEEFP